MRKRLLLAAGTMVGLVGVVLIVMAMLPRGPGVTKENFDRIEAGMTTAQVEELFGSKGERRAALAAFLDSPPEERKYWVTWNAHDGSVVVVQFLGDCVDEKDWWESNESLLDKIRRWLRL